MSSFPIVDLVVGMIFIYFLLSIICSSAVELILTGMKVRSRILSKWLCSIFNTPVKKTDGTEIPLGQAIMDHCAVTALSEKGKAPSYIDAMNFTSALIEKLTYDPDNPKSIATNVNEIILALNETEILSIEIKRALLGYAYEARDTYAKISNQTISEVEFFRNKVEHWFDTSMDRISGTLKVKYARPVTMIVAILVAGLLNADSIALARFLYTNPEARTKLVQQAYDATKDSTLIKQLDEVKRSNNNPATDATIEQLKTDFTKSVNNIKAAKATLESSMPLGWKRSELMEGDSFSVPLLLKKISGLLATILAIIMGAPFWFDLLNKISNVRGAGRPPASSTKSEEKG